MKAIIIAVSLLFSIQTQAQIELLTVVGKKANSEYSIGFGGMLKFAYPVSEADDVSIEVGLKFIPEKEYGDTYGIVYFPIKAGYRYTFDRSGTGFYVEPQIGYSVYGARSYQGEAGANIDEIIKGVTGGTSIGYLFQPSGFIQFDLSLRFESVFYSGGSIHTAGLRLTHNFSFKKRDY
jgi:hypothetical protein